MTQTLTEPRPLAISTAREVRDRLVGGPITSRDIEAVRRAEERRGRRPWDSRPVVR